MDTGLPVPVMHCSTDSRTERGREVRMERGREVRE